MSSAGIRRRWPVVAVVAVLVGALLGVGAWFAGVGQPGLPCQVVAIADGDTLTVRWYGFWRTTVRLVGVDTPETRHPQMPVEPGGPEATAFLKELVEGRRVWLAYVPHHERRDRYQRTLAFLYRQPDRLFVNLEIVRQGLGEAYTKYPFEGMEAFVAAEGEARAAGRGLWRP